jgi:hypothetical protein
VSVSGYVVMAVVLGGIWGGFAYLIYLSVKRERPKDQR